MGLTPEERRDRAKHAVQVSWDRTEDAAARTAPARARALARFEDEVDPDRVLPEGERRRLAEEAKTKHFRAMAKRSVEVRRERKAQAAAR